MEHIALSKHRDTVLLNKRFIKLFFHLQNNYFKNKKSKI
jgi:hypothetical protein